MEKHKRAVAKELVRESKQSGKPKIISNKRNEVPKNEIYKSPTIGDMFADKLKRIR